MLTNPQNSMDPRLPDISATTKAGLFSTLERVGMKRIEMPVRVEAGGEEFRLPARIDAFVNLINPEAKGIHMSRLYRESSRILNEKSLDFKVIAELLKSFVEGHSGLSDSSELRVRFDLPVERKALLSQESGWRTYPVELKGVLEKGQLTFECRLEILYSSTCPCSAALSRRLVAEKFIEDFSPLPSVATDKVMNWLEQESSIVAVPHSQRSRAEVRLKLDSSITSLDPRFSVLDLIDQAEAALGTAVQTAVKRVDEQEFARLNGQNLMFCEDAARKLQASFSNATAVVDYRIEVEHIESLHPHDAVSIAVKGVPGGFTA